jgi:ribosome biogenesis GTPase / thiamine phosphate phosphatase
MSREERSLRKHFEERAKREIRKANKLLLKMKPGDPKPPREKFDLREAGDDDLEFDAPASVKKRPPKERDAAVPGTVVEIGPGICDVLCSGDRIRCRTTEILAVGDSILFSPERRRIVEVLPRRTALSRTDPHNPRIERVIAANIDVVVNVVSLKSPPLSPGLIDRYLIAIGVSGAHPLICVNKIDLLDGPGDLAPLRPYQDAGISVHFCSASTGAGLDELSAALAGKLCVFAGHSGVGKSSLLNALHPELSLRTGAVSQATDKGQHTTTGSTLYHLPNGAIIIDTPGIREFGLWDVTVNDVRHYYAEFAGHHCAFSDCSHTHEPDCAVKKAVADGSISSQRYETYLRILASLS